MKGIVVIIFLILVATYVFAQAADIVAPQYILFERDDEKYRIEYMYDIPDSNIPIKGVYFLAHGCQHQATDWFPKCTVCPQCLELPIERTIVTTLLKHGYVALAISSKNKEFRCWARHDIEPVAYVIESLYRKLSIAFHEKPLYFLGASSGGAFVAMLSHYLILNDRGFRAAGIVPQIMNIMSNGLMNHVAFPPVAIVHMERDRHTSKNVRDELQVLQAEKIPYKEYAIPPQPLTDDFFSINGGRLSANDSMKLVYAFRMQGIIDSERMVKEDPRESDNWRQVAISTLPDIFPMLDSLKQDESAVNELMNLAWAQHEMIPYHIEEIIEWLESFPNPNKPRSTLSSISTNEITLVKPDKKWRSKMHRESKRKDTSQHFLTD